MIHALKKKTVKTNSSWWFQIFCMFTLTWVNDPIWRLHIFRNGLVKNHHLEKKHVPSKWHIHFSEVPHFSIPPVKVESFDRLGCANVWRRWHVCVLEMFWGIFLYPTTLESISGNDGKWILVKEAIFTRQTMQWNVRFCMEKLCKNCSIHGMNPCLRIVIHVKRPCFHIPCFTHVSAMFTSYV